MARDCNEVKAEIDAKIKAKGVMNYVLQIENVSDVKKEGRIVGNCDHGAKRIVYYKEPNGKDALEPRFTSPKQAQPPPPPPPPPSAPPTGKEASN